MAAPKAPSAWNCGLKLTLELYACDRHSCGMQNIQAPIIDFFTSLPPWVDRASSVLGILTFIGGLAAMLWSRGRRVVDRLISMNKASAMFLALHISHSIQKYNAGLANPSIMILVAFETSLWSIFNSLCIYSLSCSVAYFITKTTKLQNTQSFDMQFSIGPVPPSIIIFYFLFVTTLFMTFKYSKMIDSYRYNADSIRRIKKLLLRSGMSDSETKQWMDRQGITSQL